VPAGGDPFHDASCTFGPGDPPPWALAGLAAAVALPVGHWSLTPDATSTFGLADVPTGGSWAFLATASPSFKEFTASERQ
jgi:hypothetical protein